MALQNKYLRSAHVPPSSLRHQRFPALVLKHLPDHRILQQAANLRTIPIRNAISATLVQDVPKNQAVPILGRQLHPAELHQNFLRLLAFHPELGYRLNRKRLHQQVFQIIRVEVQNVVLQFLTHE